MQWQRALKNPSCPFFNRRCSEEEQVNGISPTALLACGRAGERWCSSTLAYAGEEALLTFASFIWTAREKQPRWALCPWQRHLALGSSRLGILKNFWNVIVWHPAAKLFFAPYFKWSNKTEVFLAHASAPILIPLLFHFWKCSFSASLATGKSGYPRNGYIQMGSCTHLRPCWLHPISLQ